LFHQRKRYTNKVVARAKLNPVLSPRVILTDERRSELVKNIYQNSGLSASRMNQALTPLLEELAGACQLLPSHQHIFYTQPGGLIDYALYRAQAAILIFKQTVLPHEHQDITEPQARWAYVLLSAALLRGIGCIYTDYKIDLYNHEGHSIGEWKPLWERFIDRADFYLHQQVTDAPDELRPHITPLLARIWMPQNGMSWIAEDKEAFLTWLKLLQEESEGLHILEAILERAESLAWQELAQLSLAHMPSMITSPDTRIPSFVDQTLNDTPHLQAIGLQFIKWLNENLARGQMLINQMPILALQHGLLLAPDAFRWFMQHHPQFRNWRLIQQGLMSLGIHDINADHPDGLVIKNIGLLLPKEVLCKQMNTNQHFKVQSMHLTTMNQWKNYTAGKHIETELFNKQLDEQGHWQEKTAQQKHAPGMKNG
jgi:hypothetical protein